MGLLTSGPQKEFGPDEPGRVAVPKPLRQHSGGALDQEKGGSGVLLLARLGRAHIAPPGGDFPARRSISTHLEALLHMGARQAGSGDYMLEAPDGLSGASMYLYEASVTGTETALLAAAAARGTTEIRHAAMEPHVVELC